MRLLQVSAAVSLALCATAATASGTFIELPMSDLQVTKLTGNGEYAVGSKFSDGAVRWTASTGALDTVSSLYIGLGVNNAGTLSGSVAIDGGASLGGTDIGAYAAVGGEAVQLTDMLQSDSTAYDIADDGTVVGLSFGHEFVGPAIAFVWTPAEGMVALPAPRPDTYSRANVISADGHVIAGWNDQDDGFRSAVIWRDRVGLDVVDKDGLAVGEADGISANGQYVVGCFYTDAGGNMGAWRWDAKNGVVMIPGMTFAFGVSADGNTVVGNTDFFDFPPRAAMIWRNGIGTMPLADYLAEQNIEIPDGWDLGGGLGGISADGRTLAGWGVGPLASPNFGSQSYVIRIDAPDPIFTDGFDGEPR